MTTLTEAENTNISNLWRIIIIVSSIVIFIAFLLSSIYYFGYERRARRASNRVHPVDDI